MKPPLIGLVAGEASGDRLGGALIEALRAASPGIRTVGVAGEAMRRAGCRPLADVEALSVMGLTEVLAHLPRLMILRRRLARQFLELRPDVVIGIDAPDFNLSLERRLRASGLRTAHYVSPSIWAWRPGRAKLVAEAAERVLCLLPFEPDCYAGTGAQAVFVGHPLADSLRPIASAEARGALGLSQEGPLLAVLPGSRSGEVRRLAPVLMAAAATLAQSCPELRIVVPVAHPRLKPIIAGALSRHAGLRCELVDGRSHACIAASDAVLLASGTATLETMLLGRPMVVVYRLHSLTAWILRRPGVLKTPYFSLPNLIAGREIVPELLQESAEPAAIADAARPLLDGHAPARRAQLDAFADLRKELGGGAAARAAAVLLGLVAERSRSGQ